MSSASDIKEKEGAGAGGREAAKSTRPNPVALEVPVSVTWAKPARPGENRDLYTEETVTVLVFRDGAVIQLAAAITIGQLLFLTHKKTKREVVCQVVQKRSFRPTSCFVELEFTEEAENFWGVTFPTKEDGAQAPPIAEAVAAEETTEEDRGEPVAAPKTEEVSQLKDEVQALRKQLQELKEKQTAEEKQAVEEKRATEDQETTARSLAEAEAAARQAAEAEAEAKKNAAPPEPAAGRPRIAMKLPSLGDWVGTPTAPTEAPKTPQAPGGGLATGRGEEKQGGEDFEELLPKPALDFSKAKVVDPNDPFNIYRPARRQPGKREKMAAGALAALLIVGAGVAWAMNRLPFLHRTPKASVAARSAATATPAPAAAPATTSSNAAASSPEASGTTGAPAVGSAASGFVPPYSAPEIPSTPIEKSSGSGEAAASVSTKKTEEPVARKEAPAAAKAPSGGTYVSARVSSNRGKAETSAESKPRSGVEVASNAPVIPAQLLHAVPPIYPPDAMRHYITGDVRLEAEVDAKGRVGTMNIIFGPAAFRQAAMDALRQYQYAPATQGGKPVTSKVLVTVKFWFDP